MSIYALGFKNRIYTTLEEIEWAKQNCWSCILHCRSTISSANPSWLDLPYRNPNNGICKEFQRNCNHLVQLFTQGNVSFFPAKLAFPSQIIIANPRRQILFLPVTAVRCNGILSCMAGSGMFSSIRKDFRSLMALDGASSSTSRSLHTTLQNFNSFVHRRRISWHLNQFWILETVRGAYLTSEAMDTKVIPVLNIFEIKMLSVWQFLISTAFCTHS